MFVLKVPMGPTIFFLEILFKKKRDVDWDPVERRRRHAPTIAIFLF